MTNKLESVWEDLKTQRDELQVQIHLAQADLREELESLEPKWNKAQENFEELKQETEEAAQDLKKALSVIAEELSSAYKNIKTRIHDQD